MTGAEEQDEPRFRRPEIARDVGFETSVPGLTDAVPVPGCREVPTFELRAQELKRSVSPTPSHSPRATQRVPCRGTHW
jgi:hypothetical protein